MRTIFFASLTAEGTMHMDGSPAVYEWDESTESEYGCEWDGDAKAYVENIIDNYDDGLHIDRGERSYDIRNRPDGAVIVVDKDGYPVEMYWPAEL